jgi:hypothetical protein
MLQVLNGLFTSYQDGRDALHALQALGLNPGNGHLYQERKREPGLAFRFGNRRPEFALGRARGVCRTW